MFAIVPDFERFEVKLIATGHGSKMSTDLPILEGVKNRLYYGRSASGIDEKTQIRYNEEQGLVTLLYGENAIETVGVEAYETGSISRKTIMHIIFPLNLICEKLQQNT